MSKRIPHDRLFKELLGTFLYEFLELFLPELARRLEPGSLHLMNKELFPEGEIERRVDLVAQAQLRGEEEERKVYFLIHLEHEAQNKEPRRFPRRMLHYTLSLYDASGLNVYPIALISYPQPKRELTDHFEISCADFVTLHFRYRVVQLNRLNWRDYARKHNPVAAALMSRMGIEQEERPLVKLACLRLLGHLNLPGPQSRLIAQFFDSYLHLDLEEEERYRHEFDKISPEEKSIMLELTTSWHEKGREEGLEEKSIEVARKLLTMGLTVEQIQQATGLTGEKISGLRDNSDRDA